MQINDIKKADLKGMTERFLQIISEHSQKWWSQQLDVSQGLISGSWKSGRLPRIETLFNILKIKEISPNWFFFNIAPKYITDLEGFVSDPNIDLNRETHLKILEAESELFELRDKVKYLENCLKFQELSRLVPCITNAGEITYDKDIFSNHILPLITFMRLVNDVLFKSFEYMTKNQVDDEKLKNIVDWINSNFESGQFTAIAALKSLDETISR